MPLYRRIVGSTHIQTKYKHKDASINECHILQYATLKGNALSYVLASLTSSLGLLQQCQIPLVKENHADQWQAGRPTSSRCPTPNISLAPLGLFMLLKKGETPRS